MKKRQKKRVFGPKKNLLFSGIFISGIGGYPPPPLNGQSSCPKTLSGKGGYTPPLNGQNRLSSFWKLPLFRPSQTPKTCVAFGLDRLSRILDDFERHHFVCSQQTVQPQNVSCPDHLCIAKNGRENYRGRSSQNIQKKSRFFTECPCPGVGIVWYKKIFTCSEQGMEIRSKKVPKMFRPLFQSCWSESPIIAVFFSF